MIRIFCFWALTAFLFTDLPAQQNITTNNNSPVYGIEADALPYITGGFYGSGWIGINSVRIRGIVSLVNSPDFVIKEGFEKLGTTSYTVIVDYFPFSEPGNFTGLWIGAGYEFWKNEITNKTDKTLGKYNNSVLTFGGGYVIPIYKNLYINPWIAGHLSVTGTEEKIIGNNLYKAPVILPELSVKIGLTF